MTAQAASRDFHVDALTDRLSGLLLDTPTRALWLGRAESRWHRDVLRDTAIVKPVFIAGLARSGTTVLLEFMAGLRGVATHRYRDFPLVHAPLWWNRFLDLTPRRKSEPVERSHRDGIHVTPESPEAMEEPIWMSFFPRAHDPTVSHVLHGNTRNPPFEVFFADHLRKMLLLRKGSRYVSKGNYNVTRMEYLLRLFPDARFVVPVRDPVGHVASLMKQHRLFTENLRDNPEARAHLRRVGHYEFGPDRRAIHTGEADTCASVAALWDAGEEVRGWARAWAAVYRFVANRLRTNAVLREAALLVRFEDLCDHPAGVLRRILEHCAFDPDPDPIRSFADRVRFPRYYEPAFSSSERNAIHEETDDAARSIQPFLIPPPIEK